MPVVFVGHGNPMNAIEDSRFSRAWAEVGRRLPRPRAILCVSAHWETPGVRVTVSERPRAIHDFFGFPPELFAVQYPAPGSPELAGMVRELLAPTPVALDDAWGLDHGAWSVLRRMFPDADVPVVQLSLDTGRDADGHTALGAALAPLRDRGVLVLGSGNMVHNLGVIAWQDAAFDWATEADETLARLLLARDDEAIRRFPSSSGAARLAVPTAEHFLPLLYVLGSAGRDEPLAFFAEGVTLGSMSMRSLVVGRTPTAA